MYGDARLSPSRYTIPSGRLAGCSRQTPRIASGAHFRDQSSSGMARFDPLRSFAPAVKKVRHWPGAEWQFPDDMVKKRTFDGRASRIERAKFTLHRFVLCSARTGRAMAETHKLAAIMAVDVLRYSRLARGRGRMSSACILAPKWDLVPDG